MKGLFKNKFNNILISILSINTIAILLYFFSKYVINNFNDIFFKKLGLSLFGIIVILFFLFLVFITKVSKRSLDKIIKKVILVTANLSLMILVVKIYACSPQSSNNIIVKNNDTKIEKALDIDSSAPIKIKILNNNDYIFGKINKSFAFYKDLFDEIKNKILNKEKLLIKHNLSKGDNKKKNILLITIDAVSSVHLDLYGYKRITAPNITKLAKQSLQFNKAFSLGPNTRPAVASLMTSKYVTEIFWSNKKHFIPLKKENLTFAEILKKEGYETYGVVTHSYFLKKFGYNQGFDHWDMDLISFDPKVAFEQETANALYKKFKKITENRNTKKPSFVWLHFFDPHDSYVKRKEAKDWGNKIPDVYDNEINYTDIYIGKLFKYLKEKKLYDDYIIILTSDHGEAFGEHGYMRHGRSVYNDQLWVPLIIKLPEVKHQVIEHEVSHLDIIPTILDYLKLDKYKKLLSGKSILQKIKNNDFPPIYSLLFKKGKNQYTISYKGYKLNYSQKQDMKKLFDIRDNMSEKKDISNIHPEIQYDLWRRLSKWIKIQNRIYKKRNK